MRKMMRQMMAAQGGGAADNVPLTLEVSAKHPVIKTIFALKDSQQDVAKMSCEWLLDNASIAAGMMDEPRQVLPRQNKLLEMFVHQAAGFDYGKKEYSTGAGGEGENKIDDSGDDAPSNPVKEAGGESSSSSGSERITEVKKEAKM